MQLATVESGGKGQTLDVGRFADDPDFARRWPKDLLAQELRRLVTVGERDGVTQEWSEEVELLLQQAFSSTLPVDDFRGAVSQPWVYDDEEPF